MSSRGSHRWCSKCHKRWIDKRSAHGMCKVCRDQHAAQLRQSRSEQKQRRAARRAAQEGVGMSEDPNPIAAPEMGAEVVAAEINVGSIPEPPRGKDRLAHMSDDLKLIIAGHYANYDIPVQTIVFAYHIGNGDVTRIADELGIPRRDKRNVGKALPRGHFVDHVWVPETRNGQVKVEKPEVVDTVPEDIVSALERMVTQPHEQARPEQLRSTPPLSTSIVAQPAQPTVRTAPSLPEYVDEVLPGERIWQVEYLGSMLVKGRSVDEALERARADGHLREIIGVTLRTR